MVVAGASVASTAQSSDTREGGPADLSVDSTFVWVPALFATRNGGTVPHVDVSRLRILDNGISEPLTQIDTEKLPISLVILMQTGGSANGFLSDYSDLPKLVSRLVGNSVREITLITFDSRVEQIWHFPARTDGLIYALTHEQSGDKGAAIRDAVRLGVWQLQNEPGQFRRIVLLLSQGRDAGSSTSSQALLEQLGTSSTVVYSLTFPGGQRLAPFEKDVHSKSIEEILRRTDRALNGRTAEEVAHLSGGDDYQFTDLGSFNSAMLQIISDFKNGVTLGFQPSRHENGFHRIEVRLHSRELRVASRSAYWQATSGTPSR